MSKSSSFKREPQQRTFGWALAMCCIRKQDDELGDPRGHVDPHHSEGICICSSCLANGTVGMSRRGAPVLVEGGLRLLFPVAGLTHDNMFRLCVLQKIRDLI